MESCQVCNLDSEIKFGVMVTNTLRRRKMAPLSALFFRATFIVWLFACSAVLWFVVRTWAPGPNSDAGVIFAWSMLALTFPSGILVAGAYALLSGADAINTMNPVYGFSVIWSAFVLVGYIQWFKILPTIWRRLAIARAKSTQL